MIARWDAARELATRIGIGIRLHKGEHRAAARDTNSPNTIQADRRYLKAVWFGPGHERPTGNAE